MFSFFKVSPKRALIIMYLRNDFIIGTAEPPQSNSTLIRVKPCVDSDGNFNPNENILVPIDNPGYWAPPKPSGLCPRIPKTGFYEYRDPANPILMFDEQRLITESSRLRKELEQMRTAKIIQERQMQDIQQRPAAEFLKHSEILGKATKEARGYSPYSQIPDTGMPYASWRDRERRRRESDEGV